MTNGDRHDRDDHERPGQRDWRELDRRKDRSAHRKEERPKGGKRSRAMQQAAQKEYLAGLERLFETGDAGGRVAKVLEKLPASEPASEVGGGEGVKVGGAARQAAIRRIRAAETSRDVKAAVDEFLAKWELPEDPDTLLHVLLHPSEEVVSTALGVLDRIMPLKRSSRRETMRSRLRRLVEDEDLSARTRELAARVREKA